MNILDLGNNRCIFTENASMIKFPTFSMEKNFQPPPFEDFLEIKCQFSMVSIYTGQAMNINSLVDYTPEGQGRGLGLSHTTGSLRQGVY
jgi:hypothetical protein